MWKVRIATKDRSYRKNENVEGKNRDQRSLLQEEGKRGRLEGPGCLNQDLRVSGFAGTLQ